MYFIWFLIIFATYEVCSFKILLTKINEELLKKNCTCIPYYQCSDETGVLITDGTGLFDFRNDEFNSCTGYFDVCCNIPQIDETIQVQVPLRSRHKGCGYQPLTENTEIALPWYGGIFYKQLRLLKTQAQFDDVINFEAIMMEDEVPKLVYMRRTQNSTSDIIPEIGNQNNEKHDLKHKEDSIKLNVTKPVGNEDSYRYIKNFNANKTKRSIRPLNKVKLQKQEHQDNIEQEFDIVYKCGISFIHKSVGLTAAHCLSGFEVNELLLKIGHLNVEIEKIITHPFFHYESLRNDISLVILKTPLTSLAEQIALICIPPPELSLDGVKCNVTAWKNDHKRNLSLAANENNDKLNNLTSNSADILFEEWNSVANLEKITYSEQPKSNRLPIVSRERCVELLRKTRLGEYFQLDESFLCAGGEGYGDRCGGDGGSALVCPIAGQEGRYHQAGIVSWGIGCGENNTPGVYVNLPLFRDWIDDVMSQNSFDINSYRY